MDLLILGASARAAAFSARRASLRPTAIDLFADRDLLALCPARAIVRRRYPGGLAAMASEAPPGPWLYTGSLENHPDLVDRISLRRPLWGNSGSTLRAVRDPFAVASVLDQAGLPCPRVRASAVQLPRDGSWLAKPLASAGGLGIRPLGPEVESSGGREYYQERIGGENLSAVFVAGSEGVALAGITRQLIGRASEEFAYVGGVGPWSVRPVEDGRIRALGEALAQEFGLRGIFGVDFILRDGQPWPVEVNPRYTASVEVLELALGRSILGDHCRLFDPVAREAATSPPAARVGFVGKRIVFAPSECRFPDDVEGCSLQSDPFELPRLADIPAPLARFRPGDPVLTVFAAAATPRECLRALERSVSRWERLLFTWEHETS